MHFAVILLNCPMHHSVGSWRLPRSLVGYNYARPAFWIDIARILERGKLDMLFMADGVGVSDRYGHSIETTIRYGVQCPTHDAVPLVSMLAPVTQRLGLAATISTAYLPPQYLARLLSTLDHLTEGRVGWNVVTSPLENALKQYTHDERYDRADEYLDVLRKMWSSWEPDAVVMDRESGIYADPAKVHPVNHEGKYFKVTGPAQVPWSPQGHPVIIQAGQSDRGLEFAARHAEAVFAVHQTPAAMKRVYDDVKARAKKYGRSSGDVKVLWGLMPIVGETEDAAKAKERALIEAVPQLGGLTQLSTHIGYDLSRVPLDTPLEEFGAENGEGLLQALSHGLGIQGLAKMLMKENIGRSVTVGEAAQFYGSGIGPKIVGTPLQVANQLEDIFDEVGGDGFMLITHYLPGCLEEFVEMVVPILQKRGRFRTDYEGTTLREHLMQE
ncbi:MAG: LLM class flavin-dependent oxidoreductase [Candidatus Binatus sp.]|nr:LLM class flavin-dependent oxidoreductase [Candidatus Binatus sp.]MDO8434288.1 LLM class flavin-dependent oxidoreductase [Candidatus Binatus sp.]